MSGGGGAVLYPFFRAHPDDVQFYSTYNFLTVDVDGPNTVVKGIDASGKVLDHFQYSRSFPEDKLWQADWHSPQFEDQTANDDDGNLLGQTFDFSGPPIDSKTGKFSATGRLFVNNDNEFLYFGIDETALRSDQNLFLFLESGGLPGVTSMTNVGNHLIDPLGEGADGLDLLKNLTFTNFTPSVAVLLGDEFGDAPARSFSASWPHIQSGRVPFI